MATIDIQQLIDYMERLVGKAMHLPGGKVVLDQNELTNLIEQMRMAIPSEVKQAQQVLADRQQMLNQAHDESASIIRQAQVKASQHLSDHVLVQQAEQEASTILQDANDEAANIISGADDYAEESLRQLAQSVAQLNSVIQNGLHALASRRSKRAQKGEANSTAPDTEQATEPPKRDSVLTTMTQR
ncbi:MAG: hypothetical protein LLG44_13105 [Chloroflexi bacterium]|nr:hypothetical protein [Chloroflexota bacterium]